MVNYKEEISIEIYCGSHNRKAIKAIVAGKVANANAYVVLAVGLLEYELHWLKNRYGYPIRQIELEWGKFFGIDNEFIISEDDIMKV